MAVKDQLELILHAASALLLQDLMAQDETEKSFHILSPNSFVVAQHLEAAARRGQCGYALEGASQCFLMNTVLRQTVLNCWAV